VAHGDDVAVLSRDPRRAARSVEAGVDVRRWSPTDPAALAAVLRDSDAVISVAGAPVGPLPWTRRRKTVLESSRVGGVTAIVDAIGQIEPERRPRTLVVVSGVDFYADSGTAPDASAWTETAPAGGEFLASVAARLETEARLAEPLGVRVVRLRMGHVLARDALLVRILALPVRLFLGGRIGGGGQWMSWVHIDDAVALFQLAISDGGPSGALDVVAPGACQQRDFVRAMARVLHRPTRVPIPAWLVRLVLREQSVLFLGSRRVAPARALALGHAFRYETIDSAMAAVLD
jgi:uncharacterized protein (TIGR01777 family)